MCKSVPISLSFFGNPKFRIFSFCVAPLLLCLCAMPPAALGQDAAMRIRVDALRKYLADTNATPETTFLFGNLKKMSRQGKTLVGQQDPHVTYTGRKDETDIKWTTGKELAVFGSDFMHITHAANTNESGWFHYEEGQIIQRAQKAYDAGMVNVFCWHLCDPFLERSFNVRDLPDNVRSNCFRSILPGAENHEWYKRKLQKVTEVVNKIKGENGTLSPVIFRPFHEFDGDWFWWGEPYCTPEEYKQLWRFTVTYLRDELNVHHLLYAFSPDCGFDTKEEFLERYPGDAFVDLVGFDNYWDFETDNVEAAAKKLKIISDIAKRHKKIAALTEVGYRKEPIPAALYTDYYGKAFADPSLEIAFLMFWRQGKEGGSNYFTPPPHAPTADDFKAFLGSPRMLLLPDVGNVYEWR